MKKPGLISWGLIILLVSIVLLVIIGATSPSEISQHDWQYPLIVICTFAVILSIAMIIAGAITAKDKNRRGLSRADLPQQAPQPPPHPMTTAATVQPKTHSKKLLLPASYESIENVLKFDNRGCPNVSLTIFNDAIHLILPNDEYVDPRSAYIEDKKFFYGFAHGTPYCPAFDEATIVASQILPIVREPRNEYDKNAIKILLPGTKKKLGYVPAVFAEVIAPQMDQGTRFVCNAMSSVPENRDLAIMISTPEISMQLLSSIA